MVVQIFMIGAILESYDKATSPAQCVICTEFAAVLEVNDPGKREAGCQTAAVVQIPHPSAVLEHHYYYCTGRMHTAGKQGMPLAEREEKRRGPRKQR